MKNQNTGKFINKGIEVSARSHPTDNLHVYATYSYLRTSLRNLTGTSFTAMGGFKFDL